MLIKTRVVEWVRPLTRRLQRLFGWGDVAADRAAVERASEAGDRMELLAIMPCAADVIERGEFGKPTVINAAGGVTFDKRCDVSASGKTMAVGTPGAQVVSIKRLSPTDSDLLVTTSYPELTDAVVCRVFTLKHKWSEKNGVGQFRV